MWQCLWLIELLLCEVGQFSLSVEFLLSLCWWDWVCLVVGVVGVVVGQCVDYCGYFVGQLVQCLLMCLYQGVVVGVRYGLVEVIGVGQGVFGCVVVYYVYVLGCFQQCVVVGLGIEVVYVDFDLCYVGVFMGQFVDVGVIQCLGQIG